jgi:leucyl/phenylalanyl-tRNA--protein transferase
MFPPVELANEDGVLCQGGFLTPWSLIAAYTQGIFPWPHEGFDLLWFAPPMRGVLFFDELHVGSRLRRYMKSADFEITFNRAFGDVIRSCAQPRFYEGAYEEGTWIDEDVVSSYTELHRLGFAHSVEAWQDGELVGGLYGVSFGLYFAGESMFHRVDNASKACVLALVERMMTRGAMWLDIETLTPHFEKLGARLIPREDFMSLHRLALHTPVKLFG